MKKILIIAKFVFFRNLKRGSYWNSILWPLFVSVMTLILLTFRTDGFNDPVNGDRILTFATPIIILITCITYSSLMAKEVFNDKSSRVMEILISITGTRKQLFGRLIGVGALGIFSQFLYLMFFLALLVSNGWLSTYLRSVVSDLSPYDMIIAGVNVFLAVTLLLIMTCHVGSLVRNSEKITQAVFPVIIFSGVGLYVVAKLPLDGSVFPSVVNLVNYIPVISQCISMREIVEGTLSYTDWFLMTGVTFLEIAAYLWFVARFYSKRVISYQK